MKGIVSLMLAALLCSCADTPKRPTTNTPVPSLTASKEMNRTVRSNVADSKDAIGRSRKLNRLIDNKLNLLEDYK